MDRRKKEEAGAGNTAASSLYKRWFNALDIHFRSWMASIPKKKDGQSTDSGGSTRALGHPVTKKHRPEASPRASPFVTQGTWPTLLTPPTVGGESNEQVNFVDFENGCFEQRVKKRMVRLNEHPRIWQVVQETLTTSESLPTEEKQRPLGVLIAGHPGIGKTLTLDFLLSWSLSSQPNRPVIVVSSDCFEIFFVKEGAKERFLAPLKSTTVFEIVRFLDEEARIPKGSTVLILHDLKTTDCLAYQTSIVTRLHSSNFDVVCVVASSPIESNYKDFAKDTCVRQYCVPVLSLDEVRALVPLMRPSENDSQIEEDFFKVGGVPRHLLSAESVKVAFAEQEVVFPTLKWESNQNPFEDATFDTTNKLMCPVPSEDRSTVIAFDFVSPAFRQRWLESNRQGNVFGRM